MHSAGVVGACAEPGRGWLKVPLYPHPLRGQKIWNVLGWFRHRPAVHRAAWIFVRQLNQPLKRLVFAARQLGQGAACACRSAIRPAR
jgi:hypothetical protein